MKLILLLDLIGQSLLLMKVAVDHFSNITHDIETQPVLTGRRRSVINSVQQIKN